MLVMRSLQLLDKLSPAFSNQYLPFYSSVDGDENIRLDFHPILFRHLLDQLQTFHSNNLKQILPPSQPSLVKPFKEMLRKLGLHQLVSSEKKTVLTFNVGGQTITNRRTTFTAASNSTSKTIVSPSTTINSSDQSDVFVDYDPNLFRHLIGQLRTHYIHREYIHKMISIIAHSVDSFRSISSN